jgi:hypothetical protein
VTFLAAIPPSASIAFFLAGLGHLAGTSMVASLALSHHEVLPPFSHLRWAMAAGAAGGVGLALFYRALAEGNMGIAAPVSAMLGAAIPTAFAIFTEGFPGPPLLRRAEVYGVDNRWRGLCLLRR